MQGHFLQYSHLLVARVGFGCKGSGCTWVAASGMSGLLGSIYGFRGHVGTHTQNCFVLFSWRRGPCYVFVVRLGAGSRSRARAQPGSLPGRRPRASLSTLLVFKFRFKSLKLLKTR